MYCHNASGARKHYVSFVPSVSGLRETAASLSQPRKSHQRCAHAIAGAERDGFTGPRPRRELGRERSNNGPRAATTARRRPTKGRGFRPARGKQTCRKHLFLPVRRVPIITRAPRVPSPPPVGTLKRLLSANDGHAAFRGRKGRERVMGRVEGGGKHLFGQTSLLGRRRTSPLNRDRRIRTNLLPQHERYYFIILQYYIICVHTERRVRRRRRRRLYLYTSFEKNIKNIRLQKNRSSIFLQRYC